MKVRRVVAASILPLVAGCSSMQPLADPFRYIADTKPSMVYVTYETGATMMLENPTVGGDSLRGMPLGGIQPVALPVRQVQRVSTVRFNRGRTAMLVAGLVAAGGVVTYAVLGGSSGSAPGYFCDYSEPKQGEPYGAPRCGFTPQ